jgi:CxxC motif-containing protein (DUF1111 family)
METTGYPFDTKAQSGKKLFERKGCPACHTPPLYTNNKLTLAKGFAPARTKPVSLDVLPISVGTDPGLGMDDAKGHGLLQSSITNGCLVSRTLPA